MSLVAPIGYQSVSQDKVRVAAQYILPFQFTMAQQQQLLAGVTVENGAQITILFLGKFYLVSFYFIF